MTGGARLSPREVPSLVVPWLLLIGGASIYGSFFSASKFASDGGVPFIAFTFWQSAIGAVILLTLAALTGNLPRMRRDHLASYAVTSLLGVVLSVIVLAFVASKLQAGVITLAITLTPGVTYLFAVLARVDRWRVLSLLGLALGLAGIALLVLPKGGLPDGDSALWVSSESGPSALGSTMLSRGARLPGGAGALTCRRLPAREDSGQDDTAASTLSRPRADSAEIVTHQSSAGTGARAGAAWPAQEASGSMIRSPVALERNHHACPGGIE